MTDLSLQLDESFAEYDGPGGEVVAVDARSDDSVVFTLATSPWERLATEEVVLEAEPPDFLESRRIIIGDLAMVLEFGEPQLPPNPTEFVAEFLAAPMVLQAEEISDALDQFEMAIHTRRVSLREIGEAS